MKIKHYIITRMNFEDDEISEAAYMLKCHLLKSLSIQTNKNFTLLILSNHNIKNLLNGYKFPIEIIKKDELKTYIQKQVDADFLITSRIDYDDHIYKSVVDETQKQIDYNYSVILYGLKNGVSIIDGSSDAMFMSYTKLPYRNCGFFSVFETLIINTNKIKNLFSIIELGNHTTVCKYIKEHYFEYGISDESQIKIECDDCEEIRYIWLRHPKSISALEKNIYHLTDEKVNNLNFLDFGYQP